MKAGLTEHVLHLKTACWLPWHWWNMLSTLATTCFWACLGILGHLQFLHIIFSFLVFHAFSFFLEFFSQEVVLHSVSHMSHWYFTLDDSLQNPYSSLRAYFMKMWLCFCIDMTCPITLCLAAGKGCGNGGILALLRALGLYFWCRAGLTMAHTHPVANVLGILTQDFAKIGFEEKINHRVVNGGGFGQDSCQRKGGGWDRLMGTERSPHGNNRIWAPSRNEANTHSHWELEGNTHIHLVHMQLNRMICF